MSVGDYDELKRKLFKEIKKVEAAVKSAKHSNVGVPVPVSNEVRYAGFHCIKAEEELSDRREEKALEEMQKAVKHARQALFNEYNFRLLFCFKTARSVVEEFKGYEDLAYKYIPRYREHSKNLFKIREFEQDAVLPDEGSPESQAAFEEDISELEAFLADFEKGREALFSAINERSILRRKKVYALATIVGLTLGAIVGWFAIPKL